LKQIILSATQFARSFSKVERKNRLHGGWNMTSKRSNFLQSATCPTSGFDPKIFRSRAESTAHSVFSTIIFNCGGFASLPSREKFADIRSQKSLSFRIRRSCIFAEFVDSFRQIRISVRIRRICPAPVPFTIC
jgi:hypothetical protein